MTIRLGEDEKRLMKAYASMKGISTAELIRRSVLECIEDEFDTQELEKAIADPKNEFIPLTDVLGSFGIA